MNFISKNLGEKMYDGKYAENVVDGPLIHQILIFRIEINCVQIHLHN